MKRLGLMAATAALLAACDGLRDAMSAHTDVAARADGQELSTERLGSLIGGAGVELRPVLADNLPMARAVADVWVDYQLMGAAAAHHDTLSSDPDLVDDALWKQVEDMRIARFAEAISQSWSSPEDTVFTEAEYIQGDLLSAAHILFQFPENATPEQRDSVKREAERVRRGVTTANFAQMVKQHSKDTYSVESGGLYTAFPKNPSPRAMVPEFEAAVVALKPGEISDPVMTMHGYHIVRRPPFEEVRAQHAFQKGDGRRRTAESTYVANLDKRSEVKPKGKAAELMKKVAENSDAYLKDNSVLATSSVGKYRASDLARFIRSFQDRPQVMQQLAAMPDSMAPRVLTELVRTKLLIELADSAEVEADSAQLADLKQGLVTQLVNSWRQIGIDPGTLGDSTALLAERSRTAAARVDEYVDGLLSQTAGRDYINVPDPLEVLLRDRYSYKISEAGLVRALEHATRVRAASDSARARMQQNAPPSAVPMPGPGGGAVPPGAGGTGRGGGGQ